MSVTVSRALGWVLNRITPADRWLVWEGIVDSKLVPYRSKYEALLSAYLNDTSVTRMRWDAFWRT